MAKVGAFHGGAFWNAVGPAFPPGFAESDVIHADVLDAWFPPAPRVVDAIQQYAGWLARTSPPTEADGLLKTISYVRSLPKESILLGAGSSDLLYRVLPKWLDFRSRVLITEPCYGEYAHLIEGLIGAQVDRIPCVKGLDLAEWKGRLKSGVYDLAVLVNPNNPTGEIITSARMLDTIRDVKTRLLIDETYTDYLFPSPTLEKWAGPMQNLFVLRSLSKGLALSGCRVAYMVGAADELDWFSRLTPPWNVSTFAQVAAIRALEDPDYYADRYAETHALRRDLAAKLRKKGYEVREGINWVLIRVQDAEGFVRESAMRGVYIRNAGRTALSLGNQWVRISVQEPDTQDRMFKLLFG